MNINFPYARLDELEDPQETQKRIEAFLKTGGKPQAIVNHIADLADEESNASRSFNLGFVQFLNSSSESCFLQLNEFLGRGKNTPSCEIHYAVVCISREYSSKNCTKPS